MKNRPLDLKALRVHVILTRNVIFVMVNLVKHVGITDILDTSTIPLFFSTLILLQHIYQVTVSMIRLFQYLSLIRFATCLILLYTFPGGAPRIKSQMAFRATRKFPYDPNK